ncbi:MAG: alpha/beta fold hydrolase [bacterium]
MNGEKERVEFYSRGLRLEGRYRSAGASGAPAAVICHPHPLFGGSMDNNVVYALEAGMVSRGVSTFCFNFRGAGESEGEFDDMRGEVDDVLAAISWLAARPDIDPYRIGLAGYSFGGLMAMYAASRIIARNASGLDVIGPRRLALVSPMPPAVPWEKDQALKDLLTNPPPTVITGGTRDRFCPLNSARSLVTAMGMDSRIIIVEGADHFYMDREDEAALPVADLMAGMPSKKKQSLTEE